MNKRLIVLNTLVSYARSLLSVGLSLFSTRWLLQALGQEDLGLYYAVGGIVVFLGFINTSMGFSAQRHFAYALGKGGASEVRPWFNSSLSLHCCLALFFLLLATPLGVVAFRYWLSIPTGRLNACYCVYVCSVLTTVLSFVSVPFFAIYSARQRIYELTVVHMVQSLLYFFITWYLLHYAGDRLVLYAILICGIHLVIVVGQMIRCRLIFEECRINRGEMMCRARYKAILSFSCWSLTSTFAFILRGQGIALILNNSNVAGANAALGISNQVGGQIGFLSNGLMSAISPEITKMEGGGQHQEMMKLATRTCKFVTYMILFLFFPLYSDIEPVLELWLKQVPDNTASFVRIMFLAFLAVQMVLGVTVATKAYGKIAIPELCASAVLLLALPAAFVFLRLGFPIVWVVAVIAVTAALTSVTTLANAVWLYGYPLRDWLVEVLLKCAVLAIICMGVNFIVHQALASGLLRLVVVGVLDGLVLLLLGWLVVFNLDEKLFVRSRLLLLWGRFHG